MAGMRGVHVGLAVMWLPASLVLMAGPLWMAWGGWRTILDSHPLTIATAMAVMILGLVGLVWAIGTLVTGPDGPVRATVGRRLGVVASVALLVVALVLSAGLAWSRPQPADARALAALVSDAKVKVVERLTWYELAPTDSLIAALPTPTPTRAPKKATPTRAAKTKKPSASPTPRIPPRPRRVGLLFSPGARVDARAYAAMLRPIAEAGVLVVVLKEPFGFALLPDGQASRVQQVHPEITVWVAAGHSLGAVRAAVTAQDQPAFSALVLWAGYPASTTDRAGLRVLSVSGGQDRLSTPADVETARSLLPADTTYVQVPGANHACFGDYGAQSGDGPVVGSREDAQAQIVKATVGFLAGLP